jgi:hypothetical protein
MRYPLRSKQILRISEYRWNACPKKQGRSKHRLRGFPDRKKFFFFHYAARKTRQVVFVGIVHAGISAVSPPTSAHSANTQPSVTPFTICAILSIVFPRQCNRENTTVLPVAQNIVHAHCDQILPTVSCTSSSRNH